MLHVNPRVPLGATLFGSTTRWADQSTDGGGGGQNHVKSRFSENEQTDDGQTWESERNLAVPTEGGEST